MSQRINCRRFIRAPGFWCCHPCRGLRIFPCSRPWPAACGGCSAIANAAASATAEVVNHPDMLCEHNAGALGKKMEKLIYDKARRGELSAYAIERAAQFSWQSTAERMVEIYESAGRQQETSTSHWRQRHERNCNASRKEEWHGDESPRCQW